MKKTITILAAMLMVIHITQAQWTNLGVNTHPLNANNIINSVVTDISGNVYAAGQFTIRDSTIQYYVAKWTGDSAWVPLGTGGNAWYANGYIYSLATDLSGNVYAAGAFTDQQSQNTGNLYVAKWNGTTWTKLGANGVSSIPNAFGSAILSVAVDVSGNVYAAGMLKDGNNKYYVSKWNGTSWSELGTGANALKANAYIHNIATDLSGNVYASGNFSDAAGYKYVAKWDGTTWSELGTGSEVLNTTSPIRSITIDNSDNLYVAYNDTTTNFYVAKWNGITWHEVGSGSKALKANNSINTITTDIAGNLYAAGNFTDSNGQQYVAKWDSTGWNELGTGGNSLNPNSYILTIATDTAYNVYAAGYFTDGNGKYYVAKFNPNTQPPAGINNVRSSIDQLSVTPNPTYGQATITLITTLSANINVELYDMTGRKLETIYDGQIETGKKSLTINTDLLSSGIYLVKAFDGKASIQSRFVKM